MNKILFAGLVFFIAALPLCSAAQSTSTNTNDSLSKYGLSINGGYLFAVSDADFTRHYHTSPVIALAFQYWIHSLFTAEFAAGYSRMKIIDREVYALTFPVLGSNAGLPYTELVGCDLRIIYMEANVKANMKTIKGWQPYGLLGVTYAFLETNPLDGFDKKGNYQIIRNYVNENPLGVNAGVGVNFRLDKQLSLFGQVKYTTIFTSQISKNAVGLLNAGFGLIVHF
ncbi:MAG: outer membrane beta-barrel protein [Bacteroidetes bacterium]|nr:outer membrane beta-barrel protein [Bacteroidota bacterium]